MNEGIFSIYMALNSTGAIKIKEKLALNCLLIFASYNDSKIVILRTYNLLTIIMLTSFFPASNYSQLYSRSYINDLMLNFLQEVNTNLSACFSTK